MLSSYIGTTLANPDVWIGKSFYATRPPLLILGESTYGTTSPLPDYVPGWVRGQTTDQTFTCIFNACTATKKRPFAGLSRSAFWDAIVFYNFVPGSIGTASTSRPTTAALKSGTRQLHMVLGALRPQGVLILGTTQSDYSQPVVQLHQIPYVVVPHPRSAPPAGLITNSWEILIRIAKP